MEKHRNYHDMEQVTRGEYKRLRRLGLRDEVALERGSYLCNCLKRCDDK